MKLVNDQIRAQLDIHVVSSIKGFNTKLVNGRLTWDQIDEQVYNQVWAQVYNQVWTQVYNQVKDELRNRVWNQVQDNLLTS